MQQLVVLFFSAFFLSSFFVNPTITQSYLLDGASLFFYCVFPSLFTFTFIINLLKLFKADNLIVKLLYKPLNRIFKLNSNSCYPVFVGLTSGYPMSAKAIVDETKNGNLTLSDVYVTYALNSISNPLFIIVTVGGTMLNSVPYGIILMLSQYITALINGLFYSKILKNKSKYTDSKNSIISLSNSNETLLSVMQNTVNSTLIVFGFICIFNLIIEVFSAYKIIDFFSKILSNIFTLLSVPKPYSTPLVISFFEITKGLKLLSLLTENIRLTLCISSGLLYFGGACIFFQSLAFLSTLNVKLSKLILIKITGTVIATVICILLCLIFGIK